MVHVAGKAQPAAEHDAVAAILASNPFTRGFEQILYFHCTPRIRWLALNASRVAAGDWRIFDGINGIRQEEHEGREGELFLTGLT